MMHTFIHLDFFTVAEVGFTAGLVTTTAAGLSLYGAHAATTINPNSLLQASLDQVTKSPAVIKAMGADSWSTSTIQTGVFRAYELSGGHFGVSDASMLAWNKPSMNLIYQIWGGAEKQAQVCVSAQKDWKGNYLYNIITVDILGGAAPVPTIVVDGSEDNMHLRDALRKSVILTRKYVHV
jgi:hypothetical protein